MKGKLPEGWAAAPLGTLCAIELGKTPARKTVQFWDTEKNTGNVWLSIADLLHTNKTVVEDSKEYLSNQGAELCKIVKKGTLLVSFKLTLGRLAFAGKDLFTNEAIAALTINDETKLLKEYLYWYLTYFDWHQYAENDVKIKGKTLNKAKLKLIEILLPPLPEQKRIVALLDKAFEGINQAVANAEKNLANGRELFESYLNTLFTKKGEGWVEKKLGEVCSIKHGYAFKSKYFALEGDYVVLTPGSFYEHGGFRDQGKKTKFYWGEIPDGYLLKKDDFLFAMTEQAVGLLGSSLIVPESNRYLHNQRLGLVEINSNINWDNDFFHHQFNTKHFRESIQETASGVKVRHTSPRKLYEIQIAFPVELSEQERISSLLNEMKLQVQHLQSIYTQKLTALQELKQSILQKAFSGKLTTETMGTGG